MNRVYILLVAFLLSFMTSSCFKEEDKVAPYNPGDLQTNTSNVGDSYSQQIYFDLSSNTNVSIHENTSWDLAFTCEEGDWHMRLNSALMRWAGNSQDTNFALINSADGLTMLFDVSSGNPDSTAIGAWYYEDEEQVMSKKQVYIIDRGIDDLGNILGFKKISIDIAEESYLLRYANLDGTEEGMQVIEKEEAYNYRFFSFENGLVSIEPPKDEWSLKFSRYSTILFTTDGEAYPYNVVGVLLNPNAMVGQMNTNDFDLLTLADTNQYHFIKNADVIGYAWKEYDFDNGTYAILENKNYIIKDIDGFYYKFRFTRFYDNQGRKGAISYEFLRL